MPYRIMVGLVTALSSVYLLRQLYFRKKLPEIEDSSRLSVLGPLLLTLGLLLLVGLQFVHVAHTRTFIGAGMSLCLGLWTALQFIPRHRMKRSLVALIPAAFATALVYGENMRLVWFCGPACQSLAAIVLALLAACFWLIFLYQVTVEIGHQKSRSKVE